ncbi:hypothetical protein E3D00_05090 [Swingsia samuiensis]|uniref:Uncharacterized protein n=1 Tax=Swingsia samuiensis TaxID=1293412 RepID=A0A4Y6UK58_9PROT|nr:hypothetical protein E3D00_05090 [Swingsia samuiensis]
MIEPTENFLSKGSKEASMALLNTLTPYTASIGILAVAFACITAQKTQRRSLSYVRVRHRR